ncbi:hypothetical protein [Paenibacillus sp. 1001270B_150601_E10]|uniref:hypothetical protein n=1 Tax=Paenibacillus sp. 1001270B_150601_E10 TaxID=2787079 RepID=UPI00189D2A0D|nr:hypothetical protein [Paenibacillus sp. 1001270B_150601_E10]
MLLKKKSTIISIALALILATAGGYYYFAIYHSVRDVFSISEYKEYTTAQGLFGGAEFVVIGSPIRDFEDREVLLKEREILMDGRPTSIMEYIVTRTGIHVEKVLKGPEEDAVDLKVIEPIGVKQTLKGKERYALAGYTAMKKGSQYIIFLSKNTSGQYSIINMQSGKFNLDGTDPDDFSGVNSGRKLSMFSELKRIYLED